MHRLFALWVISINACTETTHLTRSCGMKTKLTIGVTLFGLFVAIAVASPAFAQGNGNGKGNGGGGSAEYRFVTLDERAGYVTSWVNHLTKIGSDWFCAGQIDQSGQELAVIWRVSTHRQLLRRRDTFSDPWQFCFRR